MSTSVAFHDVAYTEDSTGTLLLVVTCADGSQTETLFSRHLRHPQLVVSVEEARLTSEIARRDLREVRVYRTNPKTGERLNAVAFHAKDGAVVYPANPQSFWQQAGGAR
jgi:hypothetical protein